MQEANYRPMRRKNRELSEDEVVRILHDGEYGVLATADDNRQPYATPLSYVLMGDALYFHCALQGQKIDNMAENPQVCFCVVGKTQPVFDKDFTTYYESVVVYGTASPVEADEEKHRILLALCEKYLPEHMEKAEASIASSIKATGIYCISITHKTGKAKRAKI